MNPAIRLQILDESICICNSNNTLRKGMNPTILPAAETEALEYAGWLYAERLESTSSNECLVYDT